MISPISAIGYDASNPYSMYGMYGMGMYAMGPQNLQQYKNMQSVTNDVRTSQLSFAGKINPFLSGYNNGERTGFLKSLSGAQADATSVFSPYSNQNISQTKGFMNNMLAMQQNMMMNPFSMYGGGIMC